MESEKKKRMKQKAESQLIILKIKKFLAADMRSGRAVKFECKAVKIEVFLTF